MKKLIIMMVAMMLLVTGCTTKTDDKKPEDVKTPVEAEKDEKDKKDGEVAEKTEGLKESEFINLVEPRVILDKIENKETFAFVLASEDCPACAKYKLSLEELFKKEKVVLDYIDLKHLQTPEDMEDLLVNHLNHPIDEALSTPTTYFIKDGKVNGEPLVGSVPEVEIVNEYNKRIK